MVLILIIPAFSLLRRHGRGMYTWSDGCTYDGEWRCDMMSGHGEKAVRAPVAGSVKEQRRAQLVA